MGYTNGLGKKENIKLNIAYENFRLLKDVEAMETIKEYKRTMDSELNSKRFLWFDFDGAVKAASEAILEGRDQRETFHCVVGSFTNQSGYCINPEHMILKEFFNFESTVLKRVYECQRQLQNV